mmetsp:Transcript_3034/g.6433  ORF Transcript_3034/g.6433 Transcript_3034/m.6433 type:complete len:179 (-) Transcript_3034:254-790(-)
MSPGTSTTNETTSLLIESGSGDPSSNVNVNGLLHGAEEPNATNTNRSDDSLDDESDLSETSSQEGLRLMGAGSNNGTATMTMTTTTTSKPTMRAVPIEHWFNPSTIHRTPPKQNWNECNLIQYRTCIPREKSRPMTTIPRRTRQIVLTQMYPNRHHRKKQHKHFLVPLKGLLQLRAYC